MKSKNTNSSESQKKNLSQSLENTAEKIVQLKMLSKEMKAYEEKSSNYSIRFSSELVAWLTDVSQQLMRETGKANITIQKAATSILETIKNSEEKCDVEKYAKLKYKTEDQVGTRNFPSKNDLETIQDLDRISDHVVASNSESPTYTIRFAPEMASWLSEIARSESVLTGKKIVSIQMAANTILMFAHEEFESSQNQA